MIEDVIIRWPPLLSRQVQDDTEEEEEKEEDSRRRRGSSFEFGRVSPSSLAI